jgi:hypothetical protein
VLEAGFREVQAALHLAGDGAAVAVDDFTTGTVGKLAIMI